MITVSIASIPMLLTIAIIIWMNISDKGGYLGGLFDGLFGIIGILIVWLVYFIIF